ncbi:phage tail tape measure protein [Arthrobacter rhombi]|uniref:phage tail tape measure protein n=1 Tax=Arthrobacter rhombi TaxID=71253 RepID=UPI003FD28680
MAQAEDTVWLPVLPSMKGFGPALATSAGKQSAIAGKTSGAKFGKAMLAGTAIAAAGVAAAGIALYKTGAVFKEVTDNIRVGTGATGKDLDGLVDVAKRVGTKVPASFEDIGTIVADVNTRMGLSGPTLEKVASQYAEAGRILGEEVDVNKTSKAFSAFKIEGDDVSGAMDHLFRVSQATGVGMNELADMTSMNAPAMQALGFSFEETAGMAGTLDKAGLNSSKTMSGMSKALVELAKDGEEPQEAFKRVTSEMQGFVDKGDKAKALDLASDLFGTRNASQFVGALESGKLNMEDLANVTGMTEDTILGAGAETMNFAEQWQVFKNKVLVWLEPLAARVFGGMSDAMEIVNQSVTAFGAAWEYNDGEITSSGIPGFMERLGFAARQVFDYMTQTAIPALRGMADWMGRNAGAIGVVAGVITSLMLPVFARLIVQATLAGISQVKAWAMAGGGAVKTAALYVVNSYKIIGTWLAMGAAAIKSAAETVAIWVMYRVESAKAAAAMVLSKVRIVGSWVAMGAAAVAAGIKTAAVWTGTIIKQAVQGAISFGLQVARVVAGWVLMGVQSLIQAAKMAAAWVLAMGPVGWIIATVVALAALVIANWDKIKTFTVKIWSAIWGWIKDTWNKIVTGVVKKVTDLYNKVKYWFNVIKAATLLVWRTIRDKVVGFVVGLVKKAVDKFIWLRDKTVYWFNVLKDAALYAWRTIRDKVLGFVVGLVKSAVDKFIWLRDKVKYWFNVIKALTLAVWKEIKNRVVGYVKGLVDNAVGKFRSFKQKVSDIFTAVKNFFVNIWRNGIKPMFQSLGDFIKKDVPNAFRKGRDAIESIWRKVANIARKPVNFMVNTVYNNGLKSMFNGIAKKLKLSWRLPDVSEIPAFAKGGQMSKGWKLVGEEGPELINTGPGHVYTAGQTQQMLNGRRQIPMDALNQDQNPIQAHKGIGGFWGDVWNGAKSTAGKFKDWTVGMIGSAVKGLVKPIKAGLSASLPGGGMNELIRGAGSKLIDDMTGWATKKDDAAAAKQNAAGGGGFAGGFSGPLGRFYRPSGPITSGFGSSRGRYPHAGIDFAMPIGTAVKAMYDGVVKKTGWNAVTGRSGKGLVMGHGKGMSSYYGHLSGWSTQPGDRVKAGQTIARSGNTGRSTGPHLHAELWRNGQPYNYAPLLRDKGGVLPPGLSTVLNKTGGNEWIFNQPDLGKLENLSQLALASRGSGNQGAGDVNFNGPVGAQPKEVVEVIRTEKRRAQVMAGWGANG